MNAGSHNRPASLPARPLLPLSPRIPRGEGAAAVAVVAVAVAVVAAAGAGLAAPWRVYPFSWADSAEQGDSPPSGPRLPQGR